MATLELRGPAGRAIDALVTGFINARLSVECIAKGTRYRVHCDCELLAKALADELSPKIRESGFVIEREQAPKDRVVVSSQRQGERYSRSVTLHGENVTAARAVDSGLEVRGIGWFRFEVTGRSMALVDWLCADVHPNMQRAEVLAAYGLTEEQTRIEDEGKPAAPVVVELPTIKVHLPERRITSDIARDRDGNIVQVIQTEASV